MPTVQRLIPLLTYHDIPAAHAFLVRAPELGIDVLRRGLAASKRRHFIAEDLGYILRDEGRDREAAEAFQIAADEEVSSHFIYGELAELYRKLGHTEKHKEYAALFERGGRSRA